MHAALHLRGTPSFVHAGRRPCTLLLPMGIYDSLQKQIPVRQVDQLQCELSQRCTCATLSPLPSLHARSQTIHLLSSRKTLFTYTGTGTRRSGRQQHTRPDGRRHITQDGVLRLQQLLACAFKFLNLDPAALRCTALREPLRYRQVLAG